MTDPRTEEQKVAAVAASMTMAGQPLSDETASEVHRIIRDRTNADRSVLELLENRGYGGSGHAEDLRRRLAVGRN
ncbi:hypothetical protein AALF15_11315 [Corynebacteriaceae bacterium 7-707]